MNIVVVGGCGHVGLPLAVSLAEGTSIVTAFDTNPVAVAVVNSGKAPFYEVQLDEQLSRRLNQNFFATCDPMTVSAADTVIMVVGTPLDVHLNPDPNAVVTAVEEIIPFLRDGQLLILRSTVFPGVTSRVESLLLSASKKITVAFCPERIVEGAAMQELRELPQIIGVRTDTAFESASELFALLGVQVYRTTPEEAELAKLFTNTWRYIKFAAANQFWMLANSAGVEYENVRNAIRFDYPRAKDLPSAGFSAGPCLFKDTMQLHAFSGNHFPLGNSAMLVNEGLPDYIIERLKLRLDLKTLTVGILGMAFKGNSDDVRSSLSYKLKRILRFEAKAVLTSDPFVLNDGDLVDLEYLLDEADILIIAAPHTQYASLSTTKPVIDLWNQLGRGTIV
jgi:UDP-N-acetyl-D-mannosaminuronic acid dehydrogenase